MKPALKDTLLILAAAILAAVLPLVLWLPTMATARSVLPGSLRDAQTVAWIAGGLVLSGLVFLACHLLVLRRTAIAGRPAMKIAFYIPTLLWTLGSGLLFLGAFAD